MPEGGDVSRQYMIGPCQIKTIPRSSKPSPALRSQTYQTIIVPIIPAVMPMLLSPQAAKGLYLPLRAGGYPFRRSGQLVLA